jgi:quinol monooxygenase YgiN
MPPEIGLSDHEDASEARSTAAAPNPPSRRDLLRAVGAITLLSSLPAGATSFLDSGKSPMHGLIGKMKAASGHRDALIAILLDGVAGMPGCLSYVVARDPADPDGLWITEVWDSEASHKASLALPQVRDAIANARPIIAGFEQHIVTEPVGGHGLRSD